jgi:hypothetical protein
MRRKTSNTLTDRARGALDRYLLQHRDVRAQQQDLLAQLLRRSADTVFGREHGFDGIRDLRDFQRQVPIRSWKGLEPYVDRVCRGESGVLTQEPVVLFHQTNGTTGKNKLIPVTERCERAQALGYRMWVYNALLDNPALLARRAAGIVSASHAGQVECGIPFGYVSGNVFRSRMPAIVRRRYAFPYQVMTIPDPEARRYTLMRLALQQDLGFLFTGNPGALLLLFELADRHAEHIARDIHDGTLRCADQVPDDVRAAIAPWLRASRARGRQLEQLRTLHGRLKPEHYWPGLALAACWLGGTVGRFSRQLPDWLGAGVPLRDIGYMASEGTFSIPWRNDDPAGLLSLHAAFFEFIPARDFGRPDAAALAAYEVKPGQDYQVILTTTGGLWRYAINDIVRVVGRQGGTPLIRFLHKGENVRNIAGEMLNADQVVNAVAAACAALKFSYRHLQVKADLAANRYVFHFEPMPNGDRCPASRLAAALERELGRASEMYLGFREESALESCAVRFMQRGWLDALLTDATARGLRESQFKAALLVDAVDHEEMIEPAHSGPAGVAA